MTRKTDRRNVGAENAAELVNTYEDMHRLPHKIHTLKLGPYEVQSTLTLAELTEYHPTEAARIEWARKVAGQPGRPSEPGKIERSRTAFYRVSREWVTRAQCADPRDEEAYLVEWVPTEPRNSTTGENRRWAANRRRAQRVCDRCPVRRECLAEGLQSWPRLSGVWGGTTDRQREKLRAGSEAVSA